MAALNGCHILLVDDDPDTLDLHRFVLAQSGARLSLARSADEALATLEAGPVDVLLADIAMPGRDGFDLLRQVRASGHTVPAIATSAHAQREMRERALAAGFVDYLIKPLHPADLVTAARAGCLAAGAVGETSLVDRA